MNRSAYLAFIQSLLPVGEVWGRAANSVMTTVLNVIAGEFWRTHTRIDDMLAEADPRQTLEILPEWEVETGLPDMCSGIADTLQERRLSVLQKLTSRGGQSKAYFIDIAAVLGYTITIDEFRPFLCGISRCGDKLNGGPEVRYNWRVHVAGARVTYFRTGASRCGEKLMSISRATDLECIFNRLKPAHTNLIFSYEGV